MTERERLELAKFIGQIWQANDQLILGRVRWLDERSVTFGDAKAVLSEMREAYDRLPSIKDIGIKLAEHGARVRAPLGVGNDAVLARMKRTIEDGPFGLGGARDICERSGQNYFDRLRDELAMARQNLEEATSYGLGGEDYWSDMVRTYEDLLKPPPSPPARQEALA
jgi:hypothetical protein